MDKASNESGPHPLYYAMLLFAQSGRGRLVPATLRTISPSLTAYAVRNDGGGLQITVINKIRPERLADG